MDENLAKGTWVSMPFAVLDYEADLFTAQVRTGGRASDQEGMFKLVNLTGNATAVSSARASLASRSPSPSDDVLASSGAAHWFRLELDLAGARKVLSHEDAETRFIQVIATDLSADGTTATAEFVVHVDDLNEVPYFSGDDIVELDTVHSSGALVKTNRSIVERDSNETILGLPIICRDEDVEAGVQNASMSFVQDDPVDPGYFEFDPDTGLLRSLLFMDKQFPK